MKGPQIAVMVWLGNLLLLAGGGALGYTVYSEINDNRTVIDDATKSAKARQKKVDWLASTSAKEAAQQQDFLNDKMSVRERPKPPPIKAIPDGPKVEEKEPDDDALRAEVKKWLEEQFSLLRTLSGSPELASGTMLAKKEGNKWFTVHTGTHFPRDYADLQDPLYEKLRNLDVTCVKIKHSAVVMKAPVPLPKYKSRYYEVELGVSEELLHSKVESGGFIGKQSSGSSKPGANRIAMPEKVPDPNVTPPDNRPKESSYDARTDTWTIGTNDFANIKPDELAKYAKVVYDNQGKALGIQIADNVPENNIVLSRGGRKGDIIKSINGKPVRSMVDIRTVVGKERKAGVEEFRVEYERDGVPGTKVIRVPIKK